MWLNGACLAFDNAPTVIRHSSSSSVIECSKPVFRAISFYATFVSFTLSVKKESIVRYIEQISDQISIALLSWKGLARVRLASFAGEACFGIFFV